MTRDIRDRLMEFISGDIPGVNEDDVEIKRIALNMDQIDEYGPPPNPAKETDSRFAGYMELYGEESWELDALEPRILVELIRDEIRPLIDEELWQARRKLTAAGQATLQGVRDNYTEIIDYLTNRNLIPEPELVEDEDEDAE